MTPYNALQGIGRAKAAGRNLIPDPGLDGVITPFPTDDSFVLLAVPSSTYTIDNPDGYGVGTILTVFAQVSGISVDGIGVPLSGVQSFIVIESLSGVKDWVEYPAP